jgi:acetyl esterase/lipase
MKILRLTLLVSILLFRAAAIAQAPPALATPSPEQVARILKALPEIDTNKDGKLSPAELRAATKELAQHGLLFAAMGVEPTVANAHYGPHERNVLDFWKAKSDTPTPVLVFIHGGGFVAGDKSQVSPLSVQAALNAGVSFASISYRYTTQAPFPAPMLDGARAIQFLRSKATEWNIDPKRVGAFGGSAGAGISMWLGFHDDLANPQSTDPIERQSTRLTCIGSIGGQSSYDPLQIKEWIGGHAWQHPAFNTFYGVEPTLENLQKPEIAKLRHDASVINFVTADDPPMFMVYGEPDQPLAENSPRGAGIHHPKFGHILKEKMDALHIECVYRHQSDGLQPPPQQAISDWLIQHLKAPAK